MSNINKNTPKQYNGQRKQRVKHEKVEHPEKKKKAWKECAKNDKNINWKMYRYTYNRNTGDTGKTDRNAEMKNTKQV